jgi:DNA-binding transcriptional ArsR family regulator
MISVFDAPNWLTWTTKHWYVWLDGLGVVVLAGIGRWLARIWKGRREKQPGSAISLPVQATIAGSGNINVAAATNSSVTVLVPAGDSPKAAPLLSLRHECTTGARASGAFGATVDFQAYLQVENVGAGSARDMSIEVSASSPYVLSPAGISAGRDQLLRYSGSGSFRAAGDFVLHPGQCERFALVWLALQIEPPGPVVDLYIACRFFAAGMTRIDQPITIAAEEVKRLVGLVEAKSQPPVLSGPQKAIIGFLKVQAYPRSYFVERLGMTGPEVAHHFDVLREMGLVDSVFDRRLRTGFVRLSKKGRAFAFGSDDV